jgi:putative chitinase
MPYDRKFYFDSVRTSLFHGNLTQAQVDGQEYLLGIWERHFEEANPRDGTNWLAYCLATFFHETAERMEPIEEYGKGSGKSYGKPAGPYGQCYYGRGYVQLTWEDNYKKGQQFLLDRYGIDCKIYPTASEALKHETSALVSYDGMIYGWFTGVGLPKYFNSTTEDPKNARRIVNGTDQMDKIAGYYWKFKPALKQVPKAETPKEVEAELPGLPAEAPMPEPIEEIEEDAAAAAKEGRHHRRHRS